MCIGPSLLAYVAYMPKLVGTFVSSTYFTITCEVNCSWLCSGMCTNVLGIYIPTYHIACVTIICNMAVIFVE